MQSHKKFLLGVGLGIISFTQVFAENLYLRSGATGSGSGADWDNAWASISAIKWGSGAGQLGAGDTLWIAGGSYGGLVPGGSGTSDSARIVIKRARSTNPECTSATGWSPGFDAQVVIDGINWNSTGVGSYLTIDGQIDSGIKVPCANGGGASVSFNRGVSYVTLSYLDLAGPGGSTAITMNGDNRNIDATAWNGSTYEAINYVTVSHCRIHGCVNNLWMHTCNNWTLEYNKLYDAAAANSVTYHANVIATANSKEITFRYNDISNWQVEGIMMIFGGAGNWYIYGNLWHDGMGGQTGNTHRVLEAQDGVEGPVFFYNNTIVNVLMTVRTANGGSYAAGTSGRNNLYWNTGGPGLSGESNYLQGSGSSSTPFLDYANKNYRLKAGSAAINGGAALGAPYNKDMDGNTRGGDGSWDIGAFEYGTGGGTADVTPPTVSLTAPVTAAVVSNTVTLTASASDNSGGSGVASVTFTVDGNSVGSVSTAPYTMNWNSQGVANGSHTVRATAYDLAGNQATSAAVTITTANAALPLNAGLAGFWSFDSDVAGSGTVQDGSGNSNPGTLVNNAALGVGKVSKGLVLDGVSGYVRVPSSSSLEAVTTAVTVAAWIKVETGNSMQSVVRKVLSESAANAPYTAFDLIIQDSGGTFKPRMAVTRADNSRTSVLGGSHSYSEWCHVVGVYDGSMVRVYFNGLEEGSVAFTGSLLQTGQPLCIGSYGTTGEALKGTLDEVRVYNRALSAVEVQALYNTTGSSLVAAPTNLRVVSF